MCRSHSVKILETLCLQAPDSKNINEQDNVDLAAIHMPHSHRLAATLLKLIIFLKKYRFNIAWP